MCRQLALPSFIGAAVAFAASAASASSDDAWAEFRIEVETKCEQAAQGVLKNPEIVVDPFGTESYGVAVLFGPEVGGSDAERMLVCVFDKKARTAEVGSALEF